MPKKVVPLSDTKIASAKPKQKQYTLSDGDGLRVVVNAKGRKYFRFDYTRPNGNRNSISMGTYPGTTLKEAREKRQEYRKMVFDGIDPSEEKIVALIGGTACGKTFLLPIVIFFKAYEYFINQNVKMEIIVLAPTHKML